MIVLEQNQGMTPYNPMLLIKYLACINMNWCNQNFNKALTQIINNDYDQITTIIVSTEVGTSPHDQGIVEIKEYLDCRYISPCEAT